MRQALHKEQQDEALEHVGRRVPRVGVGDEIERLSESLMYLIIITDQLSHHLG